MKKILCLLIMLLLLVGCDAKYELEITSDEFIENGILAVGKDSIDTYYDSDIKLTFRELFEMQKEKGMVAHFDDENFDVYIEEKIPEVEYYTIKDYSTNEEEGISFRYPFEYENFYRSSIIRNCYEEFSVQRSDDFVVMNTNNKCVAFDRFPLLENINVTIKMNLEVIYSNADNVDGNLYTWNLNRNNYTNKSIKLTFANNVVNTLPNVEQDKEDKQKSEEEQKKVPQSYNILFIVGSFIVLAIVLFIVLNLKNKKYE